MVTVPWAVVKLWFTRLAKLWLVRSTVMLPTVRVLRLSRPSESPTVKLPEVVSLVSARLVRPFS
ncbi:hypothetical protein D3C78_1719000 [compost metagenome]